MCHRTLGKFVILHGRLLRHCRTLTKQLQTLGSQTSKVFHEGTLNLQATERATVDIEIAEGPEHGRASARALIYDLSQDGCMIEFVGRFLSPGDRVAVPLDDQTLASATLCMASWPERRIAVCRETRQDHDRPPGSQASWA